MNHRFVCESIRQCPCDRFSRHTGLPVRTLHVEVTLRQLDGDEYHESGRLTLVSDEGAWEPGRVYVVSVVPVGQSGPVGASAP